MTDRPGCLFIPTYGLRLIVAGNSTHSLRAIACLRRVCDEHLHAQVELDVIDIYQHPEFIDRFEVIAVPLLIRLRPLPSRRITGDLTNADRLIRGLEIVAAPIAVHRVF